MAQEQSSPTRMEDAPNPKRPRGAGSPNNDNAPALKRGKLEASDDTNDTPMGDAKSQAEEPDASASSSRGEDTPMESADPQEGAEQKRLPREESDISTSSSVSQEIKSVEMKALMKLFQTWEGSNEKPTQIPYVELTRYQRRLQSLARVLQGDSQCVALASIDNELLIAANEIKDDTGKTLIVEHIEKVMGYFQRMARGEKPSNTEREELLTDLCYRWGNQGFHPPISYKLSKQVVKSVVKGLSAVSDEDLEQIELKDPKLEDPSLEGYSDSLVQDQKFEPDDPKIKAYFESFQKKKYLFPLHGFLEEYGKDTMSAGYLHGGFDYIYTNFLKLENSLKRKQDPDHNSLWKIISNKHRILRNSKHDDVHAEMKILIEILKTYNDNHEKFKSDALDKFTLTLGISKLCCVSCFTTLMATNIVFEKEKIEIIFQGTHGKSYEKKMDAS